MDAMTDPLTSKVKALSAGLRPAIVVALIGAVLLIVISYFLPPQDAFRSSELKFTDSSAKGLAIVPASCPSSPHGGAGTIDGYSCQGNDIYVIYGNCSTAFSQTCGWQCSGGACVVPPPIGFEGFTTESTAGSGGAGGGGVGSFQATGHLEVKPLLVRRGDYVRAFWNVTNVTNCTVTATNGDSWSTDSSGTSGQRSQNTILAQTVYTLFCNALPDAAVPTITETKTVNIIPEFQEASAARAYSAAAGAPLAQAQSDDELRTTIRAALAADPRTSGLSQAQVDALVELLASEAEKQGITSQDIEWRPQSNERFVATDSAAPQTSECAGGLLCTMTEAFGFVGADTTIPFTLGAASMGLVWILAEMLHRRKYPHVSPATPVTSK